MSVCSLLRGHWQYCAPFWENSVLGQNAAVSHLVGRGGWTQLLQPTASTAVLHWCISPRRPPGSPVITAPLWAPASSLMPRVGSQGESAVHHLTLRMDSNSLFRTFLPLGTERSETAILKRLMLRKFRVYIVADGILGNTVFRKKGLKIVARWKEPEVHFVNGELPSLVWEPENEETWKGVFPQ